MKLNQYVYTDHQWKFVGVIEIEPTEIAYYDWEYELLNFDYKFEVKLDNGYVFYTDFNGKLLIEKSEMEE